MLVLSFAMSQGQHVLQTVHAVSLGAQAIVFLIMSLAFSSINAICLIAVHNESRDRKSTTGWGALAPPPLIRLELIFN